MSLEKKFDVWDTFILIKFYAPKLLIFTVLYFIFIFFIDSKLKNLSTKSDYLRIEISNLSVDQLPKHYLNMNNLIDLNENLILYKKNFIKNYFGENHHLFNFIKNHYFVSIDHNDYNVFLREATISSITNTNTVLKINNHSYFKDIDKKMLDTFIDRINQDVYNEILFLSKNFNESLMQLEKILNELDISSYSNYKSTNKPLYLSNKNIIDDFERNTFSKIFKVKNIEQIEIISNPYNLFNQIKLYIFYIVTYIVLLLIIVILLYSHNLNKIKIKN